MLQLRVGVGRKFDRKTVLLSRRSMTLAATTCEFCQVAKYAGSSKVLKALLCKVFQVLMCIFGIHPGLGVRPLTGEKRVVRGSPVRELGVLLVSTDEW